MTQYETRTTQVTIAPVGEAIFCEQAFVVTIEDEAQGEFLSVRCLDEQCANGELRIDPAEWPTLREAIDRMIAQCAGEEQ